MEITKEDAKSITSVQVILNKIEKKIPVFFNITLYKKLDLVKKFGTRRNGKINYILTEKGKRVLNFMI